MTEQDWLVELQEPLNRLLDVVTVACIVAIIASILFLIARSPK